MHSYSNMFTANVVVPRGSTLNLKPMEPKKNPKYDVHQSRGVLFNFSLSISLIIVITAFTWTVPLKKDGDSPKKDFLGELELPYIPVIYEKQKPIPLPKAKQFITMNSQIQEVKDDHIEENPTPELPDQSNTEIPDLPIGSVDIPREPVSDTVTFRVVEKMPEPAGGWPGFYKDLGKNVKYPKHAQRAGATGRVFVEFTVNEKGEPVNFKVLKGIGFGCDEEATRVLALTKWNAGKQRGKPVKVRLVQQINFNISQ